MSEHAFEDITLRDLLKIIFKGKWMIFWTVLTTLLTVYLGLQFKTPVYEAQVKMLVTAKKQIESTYYRDMLDFRKADITLTQSEIVSSTPVLERTILALDLHKRPKDYERRFASRLKIVVVDIVIKGVELYNNAKKFIWGQPKEGAAAGEDLSVLEAVRDLRENVKVEAVKDTDIFEIRVKDFDSLAAAGIANVLSRSYIIFDLEQQLAEMQIKFGQKHLSVTQLEDTIRKMESQLSPERLPTIEAIGPASVKVIEQATVPMKPAGKSALFFYAIGVILGLILGGVLAFTFDYFDQSFKSSQDIESFLQAPLLGSIPRGAADTSLVLDFRKKTPFIQALHNLSDQFYLLLKDKGSQPVLFVSAHPRASNAWIISNIARFIAHKTKLNVLLIDADLRHPTLQDIFSLQEAKGLSDVIEGKAVIEKAARPVNDRLSVLTAGRSELNPMTLLSARETEGLFESLGRSFDVVFVIGPGLNESKDVDAIIAYVKNVVVIINEGKTRRKALHFLLAPLKEKGIRILGAILNDRVFALPQAIYDRV